MIDLATASFGDLAENIKTTAAQLEKLREQLKTQSQELLHKSFKEILETYPTVGQIQWTQYTPYFNDGDECVFGVGEWSIIEAGTDEDAANDCWYGNHSGNFSSYREQDKIHKTLYRTPKNNVTSWVGANREGYEPFDNPEYDPAYGEPYEAIKSLEKSIDQESMKEIFGDHVQVVVTREGIEVDEYSHD